MITIDQIKADYPNPIVAAYECPEGSYCVGGAFIRACGGESETPGFPAPAELAEILWDRLFIDYDLAETIATRVIDLNDVFECRKAWRYLGFAIAHGWRS